MSDPAKFPDLQSFESGHNDDNFVYLYAAGNARDPVALITGVSCQSEALAREVIRRWNAYEGLVKDSHELAIANMVRYGTPIKKTD